MGVCASRPKVVQLDVPRRVSTTDQWLMRPTECMGGAAQVSPYAASLPAAYPYRALSRVTLRVGPSGGQQYLVAALFEAVGGCGGGGPYLSSSSAACDHCARSLRASLEPALAAGLDPPAALRRAARDLDAAFLSDASLPAWVRASSGATMSAVMLPVAGGAVAADADAAAAAAGRHRAYAARLGAPPPFVARAKGAFSNTTVECVALCGGSGGATAAPRSPARAGASPPRASPLAAAAAAADPHEGLTLAELLPPPPAALKGSTASSRHDSTKQRVCVRAIGLGYGKDARLAQAWAAHCRRRGSGSGSGGGKATTAAAAEISATTPLGAPPDGRLPPELLKRLQQDASPSSSTATATATASSAFISCEPEVTAHALAPGEDAAVVLASVALRAALAPGELALLAHGFDARRLSALRQAYTAGKEAAPSAAAGEAWAGVEDCGASRLAEAAGPAAAAAARAANKRGEGGDLAALPPPPAAPAPPQGEPNVARVLVHVARARALDAANREAALLATVSSSSSAPPRLAAAGRLLPKVLAKRAGARPLTAADATCLDLDMDREDLALVLDWRRRQQQKRGGRKEAAAAASSSSFDDGTDFAASRELVLPPGYGAVPGGAAGEEEEEEEDEQDGGQEQQQQQEQQQKAPAAGTPPPPLAPPPPTIMATKRDVHGNLTAVVLALEWGRGGGGGGALAGRSASLGGGGGAAAVQAALAARSRSSRPAALYRWELVRLAVKARCARRRQLRAAWWAASDALRRAADAAARDAEVAAWRVLGEAVRVTRGGDVAGADAAPAAAAAGGAAGARAVVMLGMGGSAKGPAAAAAAAAAQRGAHSLRARRGPQQLRASASPDR